MAQIEQGYDFGGLKLGFSPNFNQEKDWHLTAKYLKHQDELRGIQQQYKHALSDGHYCCYCGFRDLYLEVHHINGDHSDYSMSNLAPICTLCHRCVHMGMTAHLNVAKLVAFNKPFRLESFNAFQRYALVAGKPNEMTMYPAYTCLTELFNVNKIDKENLLYNTHLLDFVASVVKYDKEAVINKGRYRYALLFNEHIFAPFEPKPNYRLNERLSFYQSLGIKNNPSNYQTKVKK